MNPKTSLVFALTLTALLASACHSPADSTTDTAADPAVANPSADPGAGLTVSDAWIREAPPAMQAMGGFVTLHNPADQDIHCDSVSGTAFARAEFHRSVHEDGMSRMLPVEELVVPAHGTLALQPGGYHIMLYGWSQPLAAGDRTTLTISCGDQQVSAEFTVRSALQ